MMFIGNFCYSLHIIFSFLLLTLGRMIPFLCDIVFPFISHDLEVETILGFWLEFYSNL